MAKAQDGHRSEDDPCVVGLILARNGPLCLDGLGRVAGDLHRTRFDGSCRNGWKAVAG